ncbi:tRNA lysidine(34) synthetase TilS [Acinetobacter sp. FDAARGOS_515]|uniref:tRNA lysidine(34) synthetase TilS n=1 Tax=Acinetobacter sp. FDAARGOS_515 TaxID=2420307 RepID=UPI000F66A1B3|nr:tRNA lysidine(34) synthetase TilS [Acinetobacter sp. FDAARGOS_515]RSC23347.1 tRNA lysidine(34) synthetase TilS [Acinetobacter sp. FDAARGOS_515]
MRSSLPAFNEIWQRKFRSHLLNQAEQFSPETTFLIGCSGGMDSMLLLHLMSIVFPARVRAIYVDHQLQASSHEWGVFVQNYAQQLNIPVILQKVEIASGNLENQARTARYSAYQQHLKSHDILVLAHHQQDQAETVLLRLLSGAGVNGLSAMQALENRENFQLWRPFLSLSREQIESWSMQLNLPFVQDQTNFDTQYDRAWCRQNVWPLLQQRYPKMQQALSRTSILMQDAHNILQEVLLQDMQYCGDNTQVDLEKLQQLSLPRQRQLLSAWMKGEADYRPPFEMVARLQQEVIDAKADAQSALHWNGHYYVRYQKQLYRIAKALYLASKNCSHVTGTICLDLDQSISLISGKFKIISAEIGLSADLLKQNLTIHSRQGGEKIHLYGRVGHWPLKKAIQEAQILPWLRHTIQILAIDNVMLGVFTPKGFWLAQSKYCENDGWLPHLSSEIDNLRVEHNS